jgi:hypothetical protein
MIGLTFAVSCSGGFCCENKYWRVVECLATNNCCGLVLPVGSHCCGSLLLLTVARIHCCGAVLVLPGDVNENEKLVHTEIAQNRTNVLKTSPAAGMT